MLFRSGLLEFFSSLGLVSKFVLLVLVVFSIGSGNVTPFIGLLGTVLGIIDAFREIGVQGTASIAAVAPGVAEALVATAAGLFTAIPAVIAYNYFLARVRRLAFQMDRFAIDLTNALETRGIREDARRP